MSDLKEKIPDFELPPPTFSFLIESLMMQAQMKLGIFSPGDQYAEPDLQIARHSIDLLAVLQEKTHGNLNTEEHRMLENGLTELRFRFVQISEELARESLRTSPASPAKPEPLVAAAQAGGKGLKTA